MKYSSLKRFFLISLFSLLVLSILVTLLITRHVTVMEVDELYDAQMAQTSRILQSFLDRPIDEIDYDKLNETLLAALNSYTDLNQDERTTTGHGYENKLAVQLWDEEGNLLVKTPTAPLYRLAPLQSGYFLTNYQQHKWHVFTQYMEQNKLWIVLAEHEDIRNELIEKILYSSLAGLLIAACLMGACLLWVIKRGLDPLNRISQQLADRSLDKLQALDKTDKIPNELSPMVAAINQLLNRVAKGVEIERRFLGDVAHELRTPLSALKLQTQIALQSSSLDKAKLQLERVLSGINRSIRLVQQLLTLARLDPKALGEKQSINFLESLIQSVQDVDINFQFPDEQSNTIFLLNHRLVFNEDFRHCQLNAYPVLIGVMLRNLIDNACRYSPSGSTIYLDLSNLDKSVELNVIDSGPGIAAEKLSGLGKRFFRDDTVQKTADQTGSGLGLSIVARIIELHQGQLKFLLARPQGLKVQISLPKLPN